MSRWSFLPVLLLMTMPVNGQTPPASFLPHADHMCKATLADGTKYEVWDRILVTEWNGKPSYVPARALYQPGSGEFFWRSNIGFVDKEHAIDVTEHPKNGAACPQTINITSCYCKTGNGWIFGP